MARGTASEGEQLSEREQMRGDAKSHIIARVLASMVEHDGATAADVKALLLSEQVSRPKLEMVHEWCKRKNYPGADTVARAVRSIWNDRRRR
jgi:DNA-binding protein Fis